MAERTLGNVCYNCGSTECTELHHVVPLKLGGTNNISNIVVLCSRCHKAAHNGRHIRDYQNKKISGRPHNASKSEMDAAFNKFIHGKIGTAECKELIHISPKSKIKDMKYFKKYLKDHGIKDVRNSVDVILKHREKIPNGYIVGYVEYIDGKTEPMMYGQP